MSKKLFEQIIKFGIVGFICFFIDYIIGLLVMKLIISIAGESTFQTASVIGSIAGFIVSVIANYLLSFKFVFERKDDLDRKYEFIAFLVLSIIGMGLNSLIIWIFVGPAYTNISLLSQLGYEFMYTVAKVFATAIVMVYNFITRKVFLEKKS